MEAMKILIVSQSFYPDNFKINDIIKEFANDGHEITVLSGLGDYTTGKVHSNYRFFKNRTETYNGCTIKRVRTISRRKGPIFRSLNYLSFVFFGAFWAFFTKNKFDLVYVYQPSPATMILPGVVAARRSNIPLLIYCLDIWPEAVKAMQIKETSVAFKWIHQLSRFAYNQATFILVSSYSFMTYLHEENEISYEKMAFLPQHADLPNEEMIENDIDLKKSDYNFVFTGNIGYVQDVETIIEAAAQMNSELPFMIHIVGNGSNYEACLELVEKLNIQSKITFYGQQPANLMPLFYEFADACLLTLKYENKIGLTIPAKLQGYMAAGKPIIGSIEGDAQEIIQEAKCGICVPSSDSKALAQALETFIRMPLEERLKFGNNALHYFQEHFNKDKFVQATLEKMKQLVKQK